MVSDITWSYLAGFWEGEGHAGFYSMGKHFKKKRLEVAITQKNPSVLCWIQKVLGYGNIRVKRDTGCYEWRVRRSIAIHFLVHIYPFLKFRQEQVLSLII